MASYNRTKIGFLADFWKFWFCCFSTKVAHLGPFFHIFGFDFSTLTVPCTLHNHSGVEASVSKIVMPIQNSTWFMIYSQIGMRKSENENNPWMAFRDIAPQNSENFGIFSTRTEQNQVLKLPNKLTFLFQIYSCPTKSNFKVK